MSAEAQPNGDTVPHPSYTATDRKAFGSQQAVADAWAAGDYPTHNVRDTGNYSLPGAVRRAARANGSDTVAELYSSENFRGYQFENGAGVLLHYSTREAIRTADGLVISNQECWSTGLARCSTPSGTQVHARLPLDAVEDMTDSEDSIFDVREVLGQGEIEESEYSGREYRSTRVENSIAVFDGYGVALGRDRSIINGPSYFGFRVDADEIERAREIGIEAFIAEVLTPGAVDESELPVVDSDDFTKTRLDDDELAAHKAAGGKTSMIERSWRGDYEANLQHFRADLQGEVIVRHGEWFFIPTDDVPFTVMKWSNRVPRRCSDCGASTFDVDVRESRCKECDHRHVIPDGDLDRRLGNHRPRESVYADDRTFVRGEVRHGDNDHNAINLGETWHEAVTHDREVQVIDTSGGSGRRGGRMD